MNTPIIEQELQSALHLLQPEQKLQVLDFVRNLISTHLRGVAGISLLRFAGIIEADDLAVMTQAIAEGCEGINADFTDRSKTACAPKGDLFPKTTSG